MSSRIESCAEALFAFHENSTADRGPFDHSVRQRQLLDGLEALPVLLDIAVEGGIQSSLLSNLKEPILYLVRALSLEWLTATVLKGKGFLYSRLTYNYFVLF